MKRVNTGKKGEVWRGTEMTEIRFYEDAADELLKRRINMSSADTGTEIHGKCPEAIGRTGKISWIRRNGNCMRKRGLWNLI